MTPEGGLRGAKGDMAHMPEAPKFRIKHVGITSGNGQELRKSKKSLCALSGRKDTRMTRTLGPRAFL